MGYYIETSGVKGKALEICADHGAVCVSRFDAEQALKNDDGVVCVVDNGPFEAAAFIFSVAEFDAFSDTTDPRPKTWLKMDRQLAEKLSGYTG